MSTAPAPSDSHPLAPTVTKRYLSRPDGEMNLIGWAMFGMLLLLVIPLLPFIALVWVVAKLGERLRA
jgi:hypothetical protein